MKKSTKGKVKSRVMKLKMSPKKKSMPKKSSKRSKGGMMPGIPGM